MAFVAGIDLDMSQPQREGDGRQASVVPPLNPAPAASLKENSPESSSAERSSLISCWAAAPVLSWAMTSIPEDPKRKSWEWAEAWREIGDILSGGIIRIDPNIFGGEIGGEKLERILPCSSRTPTLHSA